MTHKSYVPVLAIAGSDSSGGAGIEADIKTIAALGGYGMAAITAVTAQNTMGVTAVEGVSTAMVEAQIAAVVTDIVPRAIKVGMTGSREVVEAIAHGLDACQEVPVVVDPVMVSTSGCSLATDEAVAALKTHLVPRAMLITPNLPEAERLVGHAIDGDASRRDAARAMLSMGCRAVLIKGGHAAEMPDIADWLYYRDDEVWHAGKGVSGAGDGHGGAGGGNSDIGQEIRDVGNGLLEHVITHPRIATRNTHGTGCTLSSAIATHLAMGRQLTEAVGQGISYLYQALAHGAHLSVGSGHGPVCHGFAPQPMAEE